MRIMHFIYSLSSGGAERIAVLLANAQSRRGDEVCILQLTGEGTPGAFFHRSSLSPGVHHISVGMDSGVSPIAALRVDREIRRWRPDILHLHSDILPYLWHRLWAERLPGVRKLPPVVWTLHNMPSRATGGRLQRLLDARWLQSGRVTAVTLSKRCAEEYVGMYGYRPHIVANGVPAVTPTSAYADVKRRVDGLRRTEATAVFVHAARFHPNKRPDRLLEAFSRLEAEGADHALVIIGSGWDSPEARRLLASGPGHVAVMGEVSNPGDYLLASDALCLSSDTEGMPLCVLEALSCGVTPVCTPAGGLPDMLTDGETGYLSDTMSTEGLVEALRRSLAQPLSARQVTSRHTTTYTLDRCVDAYMAIYRGLLKSKKKVSKDEDI